MKILLLIKKKKKKSKKERKDITRRKQFLSLRIDAKYVRGNVHYHSLEAANRKRKDIKISYFPLGSHQKRDSKISLF